VFCLGWSNFLISRVKNLIYSSLRQSQSQILKLKVFQNECNYNFFKLNGKKQSVDLDTKNNEGKWKKAKLNCPIDLLRSEDNSDKDHIIKTCSISKIIVSTALIWGLIIAKLLCQQNIETNPGPQINNVTRKPNLSLLTFNCNGLGNLYKMKRIFTKCDKLTSQNGIIMLQETHLASDEPIKLHWKSNYAGTFYRSNSAGVLRLYNREYETLHQEHDNFGRKSFIVIKNNLVKLLVANIYAPNNHKEAISFIDETYLKILEIQNTHPDCYIILGGDMNVCMTALDCLNRKWEKLEQILAENIALNNKTCDLLDSYRCKNKKEGFTWNRGISTLDWTIFSLQTHL
jgi:exonuclease III